MNHVDDVTQAFDTIHEAMRGMRRENLDLRKQVAQAQASKAIAEQERDDALKLVAQMRAQRQRVPA